MISATSGAYGIRIDDFKDAESVLSPKSKAILLAMIPLAGCGGGLDFDETGGVKIARSACPAVAIPTYTGDVTLFNPPAARTAEAIDVTATITNLTKNCVEGTDPIQVTAGFDVEARRASAGPARQVTLPYFATVLRAGSEIQSKQVGQIVVNFADGELRGKAHA
jgi:hypothetical protein